MTPVEPPAPTDLEQRLATREVVIVAGAGGVGKTTVAAALALDAARRCGRRVLVLTVDPARRLADALGVADIGHSARRIEWDPSEDPGATSGELWAAMLDARAGWDGLVERHAPDDATRERLLANPLYRDVTGRFVHSHEYLAMERLHELHASGVYDLVVVDTPPSAHAVDVIDAPQRMIEFFESRWLKWLTAPARSRVMGVAARPFYQVLERVLGPRFGEDLAEMFALLERLRPGFVARAREVARLVASSVTDIVVVTTSDATAMVEARSLITALRGRDLAVAGTVLNRVVPAGLVTPEGERSAQRVAQLVADPDALSGLVRRGGESVEVVAATLERMVDRFEDARSVHRRDREAFRTLGRSAPVLATVPLLDADVADLSTLERIGAALWAGVGDEPDWCSQEE